MRRTGSILSFLLLTSVPRLAAQDITFVGVVVDSLTGSAVPGALVTAVEQTIEALTDQDGRFVLRGVRSGDLTISVHRIGYRAGAARFQLSATRRVRVDLGAIALAPLPMELSPVIVEGEDVSQRLRDVGFLRRRRTEVGTFITRKDIEQQNPTRTSELFRRVPGFRVLADGSVSSLRGIPSIRRGFSLCEVAYYIDGLHAAAPDVDVVIPTAISGIEIYTGSATIPPAFRGFGNPKCGVVVIWTRDGKGPRSTTPGRRF